jgi:uncharacterized protein (DUF488 family)
LDLKVVVGNQIMGADGGVAGIRDHMKTNIFTIGHSTLPFDNFMEILAAFGIKMVADVRTIPKSRHNPQFNSAELKAGLEARHIGYIHMAGLGGLRRAKVDSINIGWKNLSFRGYADYMQTLEFENSLGQLITMAREKVTVMMCAEAVPWRCHRSLIGDALIIRGFEVEDIMGHKTSLPHKLTAWARVAGYTITYPGEVLRRS